MSRLPEIGDRVWRVVDGATVFDGYVSETDAGTYVVAVPNDAALDTEADEDTYVLCDWTRIDTLLLVRSLHGWRWVPLSDEERERDTRLLLFAADRATGFAEQKEAVRKALYRFSPPRGV